MKLALAGVILGVVGGLFASRFLTSLLFAISPTDPVTYLAVSLFLLAVALAAAYVPARRASRFDPLVALRHE
jgi:ABC-type antimicrobial peptide transport system permease subunit